MKTKIPAIALALAVAALLGCSTSAPMAPPRFTHMDVALDTHERGKDAGTRLEISIAPIEGGPAVGYLDLQGEALSPNSTVPEVVPSSGEGFALADLKHEQITVKITPAGAGSWNFSYDVILHFSDGTEALLGSGNQRLSGSRNTETLPLSLATVASPSTVGKLERFGFRLLSKAAPTEAPAEGAEPPAPALVSSTAFTQMVVALTTGDQGKDAGTRLELLIAPKEGEPPVAYLDVQGLGLAPNSTVAEVVPSAGTGFTLGELNREQVMVRITQAGDGAWSHKFDAVLHFANGTEALLSSGDQVLGAEKAQETIPLYLSTVASRGATGGIASSASRNPARARAGSPAAQPGSPPLPPPRHPKSFTQMEVTLTTLDKGKDPNSRLEFFIVPGDGEPPVAYLDVKGQGLSPDSTVSEFVPSSGKGFTLDQLKREQIMVKITPGGGAWTYKFDAVLRFANGAEALLSSGDQALSGGRDRQLIPLSLATVASADSTLGRMEKYTFGLLSPGSHKPKASSSSTNISSTKEFTEMDVALTTRDRGKDAGTRLEFFILPKEGEPAVGYLDVQGQGLDPYTTVSEVVPTTGAGFTLADLKHEQIMVRITPGGHGTWTCNFDVILHFANGSQALLGSGDLSLNGSRRTALIPLSEAAVASPGVMGSMQKFGFGILNKMDH